MHCIVRCEVISGHFVFGSPIGLIDMHPIEEQHLEVDIEIERRAEPLDQGHRSRAGLLADKPRLVDQMGRDKAVGDAEHLAHDRGSPTAGLDPPEVLVYNRGITGRPEVDATIAV